MKVMVVVDFMLTAGKSLRLRLVRLYVVVGDESDGVAVD